MANSTQSRLMHREAQLLLNFVVWATLLLILFSYFEPQWETNDDVGMSMAAHGYGLASTSTPKLVFSNIIWGYFVRAIPQINGVWGYSIATLGLFLVIGSVLLHALRKLELGWLASIAILSLVLVRPVLFPQFTINAGLLTVCAIICLSLYGEGGNTRALLAGCLLAFVGYLVRSYEFLLVLLIAMPVVPWTKLLADRSAKIAGVILLITICSSTLVDYRAYQSDDWLAFNSLNVARAPFTDFGAGVELQQNPDILSRHGYTENDIDLIESWFFVDAKIADPIALRAMLSELGPLPAQSNALNDGWLGIKSLTHPILIPSFVAAIFLLLMQPNRKLLLTWALAIAAFFILGMFGRPGILRVYIPVLALLVVAPLLSTRGGQRAMGKIRWRLVKIMIIVTALFNSSAVFTESRAAKLVSHQVRSELKELANDTVIVWGGVYPFEEAYPFLKQSEATMSHQFYSLSAFTLAPFSRSYTEQKAGTGMVDRLFSQDGISIIANQQRFNLLATYCSEHFGSVLQEIDNQQYGQVHVSRRRCINKTVPQTSSRDNE